MNKIRFSALLSVLLVGSLLFSNQASTENYVDNNQQSYIPVLMYHHFEPNEVSSTVVDPDLFREQMLYLKNQGYETISITDLQLYLKEGRKLPKKPLLITMDDGYLSNYTYAYPILKELDMKATIYIVVDDIIKDDDLWSRRFNWDQAREMIDSGLIDIQSHTYDSHYKVENKDGKLNPVLITKIWDQEKKRFETQNEYETRIREDLTKSKKIIEEELGINVFSLSFPYGVYNDKVIEIGKEVGYEQFITINKGVNYPRDSSDRIKRINVSGLDTGEDIEKNIQYYASLGKPSNKIYFSINNSLTEITPIIENGITYIPLRPTADYLNVSIYWDKNNSSISINRGENDIKLTIDSNELIINGKSYVIANKILIKNGSIYIPLRAFSEQFEMEVTWDSNWLGDLKHINLQF